MSGFITLILKTILNFAWGRFEDWLNQEIRYQENKRVLIEEVKDVARKAAADNAAIAVDRESIDDSLLRLERVVVRRNRDGNPGGVNEADGGREG